MRQVITEMVWLCFGALVPAVVAAFFHPSRPHWDPHVLNDGEVTLAVATGWPQVLWVDARGERDYEDQHMPNAVLLNEDNWDRLLPPFLEQWQPETKVVVYCNSTGCQASSAVADRLRREVGLDSVYVLKDRWEAWLERTR